MSIEKVVGFNPEIFKRPGGVDGRIFCSSPHPTDTFAWCRKMPGHSGDHAAFTFKISDLSTWPGLQVVEI